MQILHPFSGSIQQYQQELSDADRYRPHQCPQCEAKRPLTAHGFYQRTLEDVDFDGIIRVRRYLCQCCRRTVSLLPEFALPYLRASIVVIALFLIARFLQVQTLRAAAAQSAYQRGQFWVRRFRRQAEALCGALAGLTRPALAADFVDRALRMLETCGWIKAHRFLFGDLRLHLLGWPRNLAPSGRRATVSLAAIPAG
jgi:transposase-like protein